MRLNRFLLMSLCAACVFMSACQASVTRTETSDESSVSVSSADEEKSADESSADREVSEIVHTEEVSKVDGKKNSIKDVFDKYINGDYGVIISIDDYKICQYHKNDMIYAYSKRDDEGTLGYLYKDNTLYCINFEYNEYVNLTDARKHTEAVDGTYGMCAKYVDDYVTAVYNKSSQFKKNDKDWSYDKGLGSLFYAGKDYKVNGDDKFTAKVGANSVSFSYKKGKDSHTLAFDFVKYDSAYDINFDLTSKADTTKQFLDSVCTVEQSTDLVSE